MSIIKKIDTFSSDDRGEIIDIFSKDPKEHCTIVTFNQNAVRGNHYHKKSIQSAYVLEGDFKIFNVKIDKNSSFDPKNVEEIDATKGHYITHQEFEAHTYKCVAEKGKLILLKKCKNNWCKTS